MPRKKPASAALQYLDASFFEHSPRHRAALEEARATQEIARLAYDLRTQSGLTAKQLARAAGLTPKTLEKLENGVNPRQSLLQLRQLAAALGQRVVIKLVSDRKPASARRSRSRPTRERPQRQEPGAGAVVA